MLKLSTNLLIRFAAIPFIAAMALQPVLLTIPSASAQSDSQLVSSGTHVCMGTDHSKCLVDHGVGNHVSIQQSGYTNWSVFSTIIGGTTYYQFEDPQGHCLKAYSSGNVTVGSNICDPNNGNDDWVLSNQDPISMFNFGQQAYLGTVGNSDGTHLQVNQIPSAGFYWHWHLSGPTD